MKNVILSSEEIEKKLFRIAGQIVEKNYGLKEICIIGIVRRGVVLAEKLTQYISSISDMKVYTGSLDITLYGADHNLIAKYPVLNNTNIDFSIDDKTIVLVDDILYTGKTIHTAIDALLNIGSPDEVQLACFIDRGRRTFPISADYTGIVVPSSGLERVVLHVDDIDGESCVFIEKRDRK
ncbi:MAG TPA: bifunctional pyr operon transcriptional regulator/uracil phosphoribosyltransferase PyrR [Firmicutes bacterium]|nr:bifunctional pyr operon transcriptional regulator/uracil phosphoribosyltransferase PyrR [Bacillota bacterium]